VDYVVEYIKMYMPGVKELVKFLESWALKIYEIGYLLKAEQDAFCHGIG